LPPATLFPYTTLFRSGDGEGGEIDAERRGQNLVSAHGGATGDSARPPDDLIAEPEPAFPHPETGLRSAHDIPRAVERTGGRVRRDRKSTRLNSSHVSI